MKQLKFSENWNCKLQCAYFTTIRKHSEDFIVNDEIMCHMTKQVRVEFKTVIIEKTVSKFLDIPRSLVCCDTGYSYEDSIHLFEKFYGKDLYTIDLDTLLLKKTSKFYVK